MLFRQRVFDQLLHKSAKLSHVFVISKTNSDNYVRMSVNELKEYVSKLYAPIYP